MCSLKSSVVEEIRSRIIDGRIDFGQQLSENQLAQELETSRQPVREALLHLGNEGLVDIRPQRGTFVFMPSDREREHLVELRWMFESGALRLAVQKNRSGLVHALQELLVQARAALAAEDYPACRRLDERFHETLIEYSDNSLITKHYSGVGYRINALRSRALVKTDRIVDAIEEHAILVGHIEKDQLELACSYLRRHCSKGMEAWRNTLQEL